VEEAAADIEEEGEDVATKPRQSMESKIIQKLACGLDKMLVKRMVQGGIGNTCLNPEVRAHLGLAWVARVHSFLSHMKQSAMDHRRQTMTAADFVQSLRNEAFTFAGCAPATVPVGDLPHGSARLGGNRRSGNIENIKKRPATSSQLPECLAGEHGLTDNCGTFRDAMKNVCQIYKKTGLGHDIHMRHQDFGKDYAVLEMWGCAQKSSSTKSASEMCVQKSFSTELHLRGAYKNRSAQKCM